MRRHLTLPALFFALVALLTQGCSHKPEPSPADAAAKPVSVSIQQEQAAPAPPPAPTEAPAEEPKEKVEDNMPTAPPDSALRFPIHKELTAAIHLYVMDNRKLPANFDALVKEHYVKEAPKPPPGKHFAVDRKHMQVVIMD